MTFSWCPTQSTPATLVLLHIVIVPVVLSIQRVTERGRRDGHAVPGGEDPGPIRMPVDPHLDAAIDIADEVELFDDGSARSPFRPCARYIQGTLVGQASRPKWAPVVLRDRARTG